MNIKTLFDKDFLRVSMRLAVPIALQNMLVSSFSLIDTLMVSQLGDIALSSVGMAGQWNWMLTMVLFGICSGASLFTSQYWGVNDRRGIRRVFGIALSSGMLIMLLFFVFAFFFSENVLYLFNKSPEIIASGASYLKIASFSYPALVASCIFGAVLRSTENVKLPMYSSAAGALLNVFFNYSLIFGKFGMPEMGVAGAALATVISSWTAPIIIYVVSYIKKNVLRAPLSEIFGFKLCDIKAFFKKAAPVICNETLWGAGTMCISLIYSNLGYEEYAAFTILKTFENIGFAFFVGLCTACSVMVGKAVGAGKIERAITDARRFVILMPLVSLIYCAAVVIFRPSLISLFNMGGNITDVTIAAAMGIMLVYALELPVRNIPYVMVVGIFRPSGETLKSLLFDLCPLWICSIPATFLCAYIFKLPFVLVYVVMYLCEDFPKLFLCMRLFISNKWIKPVTSEGRQELENFLGKTKSVGKTK